MSDAVDGFNDQCVSFLRIPAFACYKIREVMDFVEEISDNLGMVMDATGKGVQTVLRSLKSLPYGIGKVMDYMRKAAAKVNRKSEDAQKKVDKINKFLNSTFDQKCSAIEDLDGKVQDAIGFVMDILDLFADGGELGCITSCECFEGEDPTAGYISTINGITDSCAAVWQEGRDVLEKISQSIQDVLWFPSFSLPGWLRDLLDFIGSVAGKIDDLLNKKHCIDLLFTKVCGSIQDVFDGLSFLIDWAKGIIEDVVMSVINGILKAIGLKSLDELIDDILDLIGIPRDLFEDPLKDIIDGILNFVADSVWSSLQDLIQFDTVPLKLPGCGSSLNDLGDTGLSCMVDQLRKAAQARAIDEFAEMSASYINDKVDQIAP